MPLEDDKRRGRPIDLRRADEARAAAEQRAAAAVVLFAAVARLHDADARDDVTCAIAEIAVEGLGAHEAALFIGEDEGGPLHLARHAVAGGSASADEALHGLAERCRSEGRVVLGACGSAGIREIAVPLGMSSVPLGMSSTLGVLVLRGLDIPAAGPAPELHQQLVIIGRHAGIALARSCASREGRGGSAAPRGGRR